MRKERHKKSPPSPAKRQREKADGCARRATRAHPHPDTHDAHSPKDPKETHIQGVGVGHTQRLPKKKRGVGPVHVQPATSGSPPRPGDRQVHHTRTCTNHRKKKKERKKKRKTPRPHTQTHSDTYKQSNAKEPHNARRNGRTHTAAAHKSGTPREGTKKKKRKKKRGRDGRRRPPLLPPPHAAAVPAVSSRCLHPLYNAAAGGLTNRRPTSRHTSAASAARRSRQ